MRYDSQDLLLDDTDKLRLRGIKFHIVRTNKKGKEYVTFNKNSKTVYLHRFLLNAESGQEVDHINGNGIDNRRNNLRICTHRQNQLNQKKRKNCISKFKGVSLKNDHGRKKSWIARIHVNGKTKILGYFLTEIEAALKYNDAAKKHYGEFAKLNNTVPIEGKLKAQKHVVENQLSLI